MFTSSLPLLPPPATSLLPPLHDIPATDASAAAVGPNSLQAQQQQQQRRTRGHPHAVYPRSQLAVLAHDERVIAQRKLAIAMYGYSWLKPAGCTKTMLGRREEEIEREEVERQLREAELQERNAAEIEEVERQAHLDQQRAREMRGEDAAEEGERDLDEDVPDMDDADDDEFEDEGSEEEDDEDDEDLDNDIPEADTAWTYDTTRDPDTESEDEMPPPPRMQQRPQQAQARATIPGLGSYTTADDQEQAEEEAIANAMLYEDELGEYDQGRDLDDDVPDMDGETHNLDDDVPEADDEDGGWEHTDTELEESDMDISIMPPGATAHHVSMPPPSSNIGQRQRRNLARQSIASHQSDASTGIRRTSGNVQLPPLNQPVHSQTGARGLVRFQQMQPNFTPDQLGSEFSVSALISTGNTDVSSVSANPAQQAGRGFLDPAGARRNLFGAGRGRSSQAQATGYVARNFQAQDTVSTIGPVPNIEPPQIVSVGSAITAPRQVSSGGLFTPSPQQQNVQRIQPGLSSVDEPRSRTRSGRVLDGIRGARRQGAV